MPTYTVHFFTEADWAETTIKARTPKRALAAAQQLADDDLIALNFHSYDGTSGIERIEVWGPNRDTVAAWQSDELWLRLAAGDLLEALTEQTEAAQAVLDCWAHGNLAGAVCRLDGAVAVSRTAIAKAKGGAA
jgi:hypothetical protein